MPDVKPGESAKDYVKRCVKVRQKEHPTEDPKQSVAICYSMYKKRKENNMNIKENAKWTAAFINTLPNSSFAYVESCYGKDTKNKNARHLPYKDANGSVDLSHLRNALARVSQMKLVCGGDVNAARTKARNKLIAAAKKAGVGDYKKKSNSIDNVFNIHKSTYYPKDD